MANETNTPPSITRNGITKVLAEQTFGKRSDNAGKKFYAPEFSIGDFANDSVWTGADWFISMGNKAARRIFGEMHVDNIDEKTGLLNFDAWKIEAEDFTAGVVTLRELQEEVNDLVDQQSTLATGDKFGEVDSAGEPTADALEVNKAIVAITAKLRPLRVQMASIKQKYEAVVAKREAAKAAKEAAKPKTATPATA